MFLFQLKTTGKAESTKSAEALQRQVFELVRSLDYTKKDRLDNLKDALDRASQQKGSGEAGLKAAAFASKAYEWLANRYNAIGNLKEFGACQSGAQAISGQFPSSKKFAEAQDYAATYLQVVNSIVVKQEGERPFALMDAKAASDLALIFDQVGKAKPGATFTVSFYAPKKGLAELFRDQVLHNLPVAQVIHEEIKERGEYEIIGKKTKAGYIYSFTFESTNKREISDNLPPTPKDSEFVKSALKASPLEALSPKVQVALATSPGSVEEEKKSPKPVSFDEMKAFASALKEQGDVLDSSEASRIWKVNRVEGLYYAAKGDPINRESMEKIESALKANAAMLVQFSGLSEKDAWAKLIESLVATAGANVEACAIIENGKIQNYDDYRNLLVKMFSTTATGRGEMVKAAAGKLLLAAGFSAEEANGMASRITVKKTLHLYQDFAPALKEKLLADSKVPQEMKDWISCAGAYKESGGYRAGSGQGNLNSFMEHILSGEGENGNAYRTLTGKNAAIELGGDGNYRIASGWMFNKHFSAKSSLRDEYGLGDGFSGAIKKGRFVQFSSKEERSMSVCMSSKVGEISEGEHAVVNFYAYRGGQTIQMSDLVVKIYDQNGVEQKEVGVVKNTDSENGPFTVFFTPEKPGTYSLVAYGVEGKLNTDLLGQTIVVKAKEKPAPAPEKKISRTPSGVQLMKVGEAFEIVRVLPASFTVSDLFPRADVFQPILDRAYNELGASFNPQTGSYNLPNSISGSQQIKFIQQLRAGLNEWLGAQFTNPETNEIRPVSVEVREQLSSQGKYDDFVRALGSGDFREAVSYLKDGWLKDALGQSKDAKSFRSLLTAENLAEMMINNFTGGAAVKFDLGPALGAKQTSLYLSLQGNATNLITNRYATAMGGVEVIAEYDLKGMQIKPSLAFGVRGTRELKRTGLSFSDGSKTSLMYQSKAGVDVEIPFAPFISGLGAISLLSIYNKGYSPLHMSEMKTGVRVKPLESINVDINYTRMLSTIVPIDAVGVKAQWRVSDLLELGLGAGHGLTKNLDGKYPMQVAGTIVFKPFNP